MSNTGGGHRASAEAINAVIAELFGEQIVVKIIDLITDHTPWPVNQIPKAYPFLSNDAPGLWKALYDTTAQNPLGKLLVQLGSKLSLNSVCKIFESYQPDLIISVHPLVNIVGLNALRKLDMHVPFVTVVTDLSTAHPLWFHTDTAACYVATEYSYRLAIEAGMKPSQLHILGLPVRPAFAKFRKSKERLRSNLGMNQQLPAVLIVGGGEGIGPVEEIASRIADKLSESGEVAGQQVVVCGRNKILFDRLNRKSWSIPTYVNGFLDNMPDWMAACDCVVTKAGPGTIAEAMICGLPIVLSDFIPGQEDGNITFVVENGIGYYTEDPNEIATIIGQWFKQDRTILAEMAAQSLKLSHPQATYDIVRSIIEVLENYSPSGKPSI